MAVGNPIAMAVMDDPRSMTFLLGAIATVSGQMLADLVRCHPKIR